VQALISIHFCLNREVFEHFSPYNCKTIIVRNIYNLIVLQPLLQEAVGDVAAGIQKEFAAKVRILKI